MKRFLLISLLCLLVFTPLWGEEPALNLDLEKAVNLCYQNNLLFKQKAYELEEAKARFSQAGAAFLPQLSASYSYIRKEPVPEFKLGSDSSLPIPDVQIIPRDNYQATLSLSQLVTSFGKVENSVKAAQLGVTLSQLELNRVKNDLKFQVTQAYSGAYLARQSLGIALDKVESVRSHLKVAEQKFQQGTAPKFDLVREETSLAQSLEEQIKAENDASLALNSLKNLLGLNLDTRIQLSSPPEAGALKLSEEEAIKIAAKNRPELLQLKTQVELADKNLKTQLSEYYPTVSLNASYDWTRNTLMSNPRSFTGMAVLAFPVFQGDINPRIKEAKNAFNRSEIAYEDLTRNVKLEIKQALLSLESAKARVATAKKNVELAGETLAISKVRYREGMGTLLELNDAELALRTAELAKEAARSDHQVAYAALLKAIGCVPEEKK